MKSESEIKEWIDELAEEQREEERQRSRRREREQQTLEEMRQRRIEKVRERCEEKGGDPDLLLTLLEFDEELIEEDEEGIEERRQELIDQGEDVIFPTKRPHLSMERRSDPTVLMHIIPIMWRFVVGRVSLSTVSVILNR